MSSSSGFLALPGACLALTWLTVLIFGGRRRFKAGLVLASALYIFYAAAYQDYTQVIAFERQLAHGSIAIRGWVEQTRTYSDGLVVKIRPEGLPSSVILTVFTDGQTPISPGDYIFVQGNTQYKRGIPPRHWLWWDPFDLSGWTIGTSAGEVSLISEGGFNLRRLLVERTAEVQCQEPQSVGMLKALLFGDRSEMDPDISENAQKIGVSHLFALSGMHLGLYISVLTLILRRKGLILTTCGICLFASMSGGGASAVRALASSLYLLLASHFGSEVSIRDAFYRVLLGLIWLNPAFLFDLGFRLSIVAVWSLALYNSFSRGSSRISRIVGCGLFVNAATMPLVAGYFGVISPWGPVLTIICLPFIVALIFVGILALPFLATGTAHLFFRIGGPAVDLLTSWLELILASAIRLPGATVTVGTIGIALLAANLVFVAHTAKSASIVAGGSSKCLAVSLSCFLCVMTILQGGSICYSLGERTSPWLAITALDVGHGDAFCIHLPGGAGMLIDAGGSAECDLWDWVGRTVIGNYLTYANRTTLDTVMVSHWHSDHSGGLLPVLAKTAVGSLVSPAGLVPPLIPCPISPNGIVAARRGWRFEWSGCSGLILYPVSCPPDFLTNPNCASLVFRLEYDQFSMVFTGDLPAKDQRVLASAQEGRSVVLKVPHHGGHSLTSEWLAVVNPAAALISGAGPSKGQPNQDTLATLSRGCLRVLRTDQSGNIRIATDGRQWHIATTAGDANGEVAWQYHLIQLGLQLL